MMKPYNWILALSIVCIGCVDDEPSAKADPPTRSIPDPISIEPETTPADPPPTQEEEPKPWGKLPYRQHKLMEIVGEYKEKYKTSYHRGIEREREDKIAKLIGSNLNMVHWLGTLEKIRDMGNGDVCVEIKLAGPHDITVKTWWDNKSKYFPIKIGTTIYKKIKARSVGERVKYSGQFQEYGLGYLIEDSYGEHGTMNSPKYVIELTDIRLYE